jgi:hypothetical protein
VLPLSADSFVQETTGWATVAPSGTLAVTLASGTAAGNTALVVVVGANANLVTLPAGWQEYLATSFIRVMGKPGTASSETGWTFNTTLSLTRNWTWYAAELSGLELAAALDASATNTGVSISDGGTLSTGTTSENSGLETLQLAVFAWNHTAAGTGSWSGYTGGFEEVVDVADAASSGNHWGFALARRFEHDTTGQFSATATFAGTASSPDAGPQSALLIFRAADSPIRAPLCEMAGFDWATHGGIGNQTTIPEAESLIGRFSTSGPNFAGTWGTHYSIGSGFARDDGYGLRITTTSAICYLPLRLHPLTGAVTRTPVHGINLRVVSATGTVVVLEAVSAVTFVLYQVLYDTSTNKFGVRWGTSGTVAWQDGTTALNTWVWVDLRAVMYEDTSKTFSLDWRLETGAATYTSQPTLDRAGSSTNYFVTLRLGANATQTMTVDYDDEVGSTFYSAYPLGPHKVALLTVDPAGTPTLSGTSTNFSVFTANGTLAAWNATNARNAVDEVPPTVSASADGVCQTATAASDYIEFPMAAPVLAADEFVSGVRLVAAMWGGTGAGTGGLGLRGWDGTTEANLIPATTSYDAGSPTALSATDPLWLTKMWTPSGGWTLAKLDAAAVRFGFSPDAAPDMGVEAFYLEYAKGRTRADTVIGEVGSVVLDANTDPNSLGTRSLALDTPAGQGATLNWTVGGVDDTQNVAAASSHTESFDGAGEVTFVEVVSGNEAPDRE